MQRQSLEIVSCRGGRGINQFASFIALRATLEALKDQFNNAEYAGLACGIKNCGIGNGVPELSEAKIEIKNSDQVILHHGWTEMGQGLDTVAQQILWYQFSELAFKVPEEYIQNFGNSSTPPKDGYTAEEFDELKSYLKSTVKDGISDYENGIFEK